METARKCNFETGDECHEREAENFLENEHYRILRNFSIETHHIIEAQRPDSNLAKHDFPITSNIRFT